MIPPCQNELLFQNFARFFQISSSKERISEEPGAKEGAAWDFAPGPEIQMDGELWIVVI